MYTEERKEGRKESPNPDFPRKEKGRKRIKERGRNSNRDTSHSALHSLFLPFLAIKCIMKHIFLTPSIDDKFVVLLLV